MRKIIIRPFKNQLCVIEVPVYPKYHGQCDQNIAKK